MMCGKKYRGSGPRRRPASRLLLFVVVGVAAVAASSSHGTASSLWSPQRGRPNIADEVDAGEKRKSEATRRKAKPAAADAAARGTPRARAKQAPASRPTPSPLLDVTFTTGVADFDIYMRRSDSRLLKLGKTGRDGRLVAKLPRGSYLITASRPGYPVEHQQITVRPGQTAFAFNFTGEAGAASGTTTGATMGATTVEEVIKRFLDPKHTDAVTAADWQRVRAQANAAFVSNPTDPQVESQALFVEGQLAYLRGDYPSALVSFNTAALKMQSSGLAYYGLGNAYLATRQPGEAARAFQRAIELNPTLAMAYKGMGDALSRQGKSKESLNYYERARSLGYTSSEASLSAARNLLKQRRWSQALRELSELSKTNPSAEVFIGIGDSYVGLEQPLSAAPAYRRAMELDPRSAIAHYKYGALVYELREYEAAMEALTRALALDPTGTSFSRSRAQEMANKATEKIRRMK